MRAARSLLPAAALGFCAAELDHRVREIGGENAGPRIRQYAENADPPIHADVAWCTLFIQYGSDRAAGALGIANPLDAVKREAFVADYWQWGVDNGRIVMPRDVEPGHLMLMSFGGERFDHIGIVARRGADAAEFVTIEGNTSNPAADPDDPNDEREGDGVFEKVRRVDRSYGVAFIRWS